jgi:glutamyl-Q tRNA(Asp) synthetase
VNAAGERLSKQTRAMAIDGLPPAAALVAALGFLGQGPPAWLASAGVAEVWAWALAHWCLPRVPRKRALQAPAGSLAGV